MFAAKIFAGVCFLQSSLNVESVVGFGMHKFGTRSGRNLIRVGRRSLNSANGFLRGANPQCQLESGTSSMFLMPKRDYSVQASLEGPVTPTVEKAGVANEKTLIPRSLRIVLISDAFNSMSQRVLIELNEMGHRPVFVEYSSPEGVVQDVKAADPDLVLCPFLTKFVPEELFKADLLKKNGFLKENGDFLPVIIIHPGISFFFLKMNILKYWDVKVNHID